MNFANNISMLWNETQKSEISQSFDDFFASYKGFCLGFSLIFHEILILFDQCLKGQNYWTKHGKDPILFLIEPWH